ncbi:hypothetical protein AM368_19625 [Serratia marcescens]|nr:hypothetical protein AM368_19625 [Serratia marcescens]
MISLPHLHRESYFSELIKKIIQIKVSVIIPETTLKISQSQFVFFTYLSDFTLLLAQTMSESLVRKEHNGKSAKYDFAIKRC